MRNFEHLITVSVVLVTVLRDSINRWSFNSCYCQRGVSDLLFIVVFGWITQNASQPTMFPRFIICDKFSSSSSPQNEIIENLNNRQYTDANKESEQATQNEEIIMFFSMVIFSLAISGNTRIFLKAFLNLNRFSWGFSKIILGNQMEI